VDSPASCRSLPSPFDGCSFPCKLKQVLEAKLKIEEAKGFSAESQKLIHSGKILVDDKPLAEYNLKPTDFLVCMVTKVMNSANL
jgi:hypothetical protein